ncbi:MAG: hypothetical protein DDT21_00939 [Syntrophomonadaceae bacterium]|nr:hypothetical protein [Bacillota bacterium]
MANQVSRLLTGMTDVYSEQLALYGRLHEMTLLESSAIEAGDALGLAELLRLEDLLIGQVRELEELQRESRQLLYGLLPAQRLDMDQLACLAEPKVYIRLKQLVGEITAVLGRLEAQKKQNMAALTEKMALLKQESLGLGQGKQAAGAYAGTWGDGAAILDLKQ